MLNDEENYTRAVISNVLFERNDGMTRSTTSKNNNDTVTVYIGRQSKEITGKEFTSDNEFTKLNDEGKKSTYTYRKGDYIAEGNIELGDVTFNEFKQGNQLLYEITSVGDFRFGGLANIKIGAK
jgi:hypothetical protein